MFLYPAFPAILVKVLFAAASKRAFRPLRGSSATETRVLKVFSAGAAFFAGFFAASSSVFAASSALISSLISSFRAAFSSSAFFAASLALVAY